MNKELKEPRFIVATLPNVLSFDSLDPSLIKLADEYTVLEHLFSPLVEINSSGEIVSGISNHFYWEGTNAIFHIREDYITGKGVKLDAEDAAISLKRLLIIGKNSHGQISSLLCGDTNIRSIKDNCSSISYSGQKLTLKFSKKIPFLFKLLSSIDYAVIPKDSIDLETLKIKDFESTSGPYKLKKNTSSGEIFLEANSSHYHYSEDMPQAIKYIVPSKKSIDLLQEGSIDIITTDDITSEGEELIQFAKKHSYKVHKTLKIENNILMYTKNGYDKINLERRIKLGKIIREAFSEEVKNSSISATSFQFFPKQGEGGLSELSLSKLEKRFDVVSLDGETGEGITLGVQASRFEYISRVVLKALPNLNLKKTERYSDVFDESDEFGDMVIFRTDTGFLEEISLISYSVNTGFFSLDKEFNKSWLEMYTNETDKKTRLKKLNDFHFDSLIRGQIVPLYNTSYVVLSNENWEVNFSPYYSNSQLWKVKRK